MPPEIICERMLAIPEYCLGYTKGSGSSNEREGAHETGHSTLGSERSCSTLTGQTEGFSLLSLPSCQRPFPLQVHGPVDC